MMTFGEAIKVTIFGSSHGPEVGATLEGIPAGRSVDVSRLQAALDRRRPVGRRLATKRHEEDKLVIDSGIEGGRTDGRPIRAHVANTDVDRSPYDRLRDLPRPGHADYPARVRYGDSADLSGGGIFSGRMTVGLVFAGAFAQQMLEPMGVDVLACCRAIDGVVSVVPDVSAAELRERIAANEVGCADLEAARAMEEAIAVARRDGDSVGGVVECRATGLPVGAGEPFFDSVESCLAHALFSIPAVKGVEFGAGFAASRMRGSEDNDAFAWEGDRVVTRTNHAGGILGGLTTGMPMVVRVAIKPTASIARRQTTVNLATHTVEEIVVTGRHDPCIVPRAVVVVESVTAFALLDLLVRGGLWK